MVINLSDEIVTRIAEECGKPVIVSKGTAVGFGKKMPENKWISGLSETEKNAIRDDTAVVIVVGCPPHVNGRRGKTYRRAVNSYGNWFTHRLI